MNWGGEILLNILLDDIDQEIKKQFPNMNYVRLDHEILIPLYGENFDCLYTMVLEPLFLKLHFMPPTIERAERGGEPIQFSGGLIHIHEDGQIRIQSDAPL